jgi:hypothetical protein
VDVETSNAIMAEAAAVLSEIKSRGMVAIVYKNSAEIVDKHCKKCGGEGWLWGYELENPPEVPYGYDDTRYSCDSEIHHISNELRKLSKVNEKAVSEIDLLKAENELLRESLKSSNNAMMQLEKLLDGRH